MPAPAPDDRGMGSMTISNISTTPMPEPEATLSEREQLKIEFYKTYDVMTGVRIAATLGGFFSLMILLLVYKSRCKSSKQLEDPRLTAAAAAAVAEAEAEERALEAALEAIARLPPRPDRGPRRSLCVEVIPPQLPRHPPRFASVGGGYEALLTAPKKPYSNLAAPSEQRRCSSVTCSSTGSGYLERRGSGMTFPTIPSRPHVDGNRPFYEDGWDLYYSIDIQVIQPTPELSPCTSEAGLYVNDALIRRPNNRRAPLASMGSVDPPEPDSRSLGSDSVFLREEDIPDTEDEVSGFSTDSDGPGPSGKRFLRVPGKRRKPIDKWDGCVGCVPRRWQGGKGSEGPCGGVAAFEAPRCHAVSTSSSSQTTIGSPEIELRHRPPPLPSNPPVWSQETLF